MTRPARIARSVTVARRAPDPKRSRKHLDYIRALPCIVCFRHAPSEAAHIRTGTDGGMGVKPSDRYTLPMCRAHHEEQHRVGEVTFWSERGIDAHAKAEALYRVSGDMPKGLRIILRAQR